VIFSFDPRPAAPCRHAPCPDKSLCLNLFADPHPLNPYATIFYKKGGGRSHFLLRGPHDRLARTLVTAFQRKITLFSTFFSSSTFRRSDLQTFQPWFSVHSSKFRIPQVLCLPLLCIHRGVWGYSSHFGTQPKRSALNRRAVFFFNCKLSTVDSIRLPRAASSAVYPCTRML
jgi:hypothetical protein